MAKLLRVSNAESIKIVKHYWKPRTADEESNKPVVELSEINQGFPCWIEEECEQCGLRRGKWIANGIESSWAYNPDDEYAYSSCVERIMRKVLT
jgi:hypothetical protein